MNANDVIDRAKEAMGIEHDQDLATKLSVSRSTVAAWRRRGSIPTKYLSEMMIEGTVSLDWLLTGVGDRMSANRDGWANMRESDEGLPLPPGEVFWLSLLLARRELKNSHRKEETALAEHLSDDILAAFHIMLTNYIRRLSRSRTKWLKSGIVAPHQIYNALVAEYGFGKFENPPPPWWNEFDAE